MALLTLFRIATGDNWNGIMKVYLCFNLKYFLKTLLFLFYKLDILHNNNYISQKDIKIIVSIINYLLADKIKM